MLETPEERIKLLKAGLTGKAIEKLYIEHNNFKIVRIPLLIKLVEFDIQQNKGAHINCDAAFECARSFHAGSTPLY